jgi:hypothetical protein
VYLLHGMAFVKGLRALKVVATAVQQAKQTHVDSRSSMSLSALNLELLWMLALPLFGSIAFAFIGSWAESTRARHPVAAEVGSAKIHKSSAVGEFGAGRDFERI